MSDDTHCMQRQGNGGPSRSERWRTRQRQGLIPVTVEIAPAHRRALERMGLIPVGMDADRTTLAQAASRFLDAAPAVVAMGDALYPVTSLPENTVCDE